MGLKDIKEASGAMLPEDRVARTMDLQEDIAAKLEILKGCAATEAALLPQGDKVDKDAQAFKNELNSWVAKDKSSEGENQFSLEKMESTLGELKNIFKEKEK